MLGKTGNLLRDRSIFVEGGWAFRGYIDLRHGCSSICVSACLYDNAMYSFTYWSIRRSCGLVDRGVGARAKYTYMDMGGSLNQIYIHDCVIRTTEPTVCLAEQYRVMSSIPTRSYASCFEPKQL